MAAIGAETHNWATRREGMTVGFSAINGASISSHLPALREDNKKGAWRNARAGVWKNILKNSVFWI